VSDAHARRLVLVPLRSGRSGVDELDSARLEFRAQGTDLVFVEVANASSAGSSSRPISSALSRNVRASISSKLLSSVTPSRWYSPGVVYIAGSSFVIEGNDAWLAEIPFPNVKTLQIPHI